MKKIILFSIFCMAVTYSAFSQNTIFQNGYIKPSTGTYVEPHYKTSPNSTNIDNFSTKGNYNPYSGQSGYKARDYSTESLNYGNNKTIYTGERGGQYYINDNGNKTYVPKRKNW